MHKVLIAGAGKIGSSIGCLLARTSDYQVILGDIGFDNPDVIWLKGLFPQMPQILCDVTDQAQLSQLIQTHGIQTIVSSLPFFCNESVAQVAKKEGVNYFDLTEDVATTEAIRTIASNASTIFMPQCGLAPGFIGIAAHSLMESFDEVKSVKLRVGALPVYPCNALNYALTWSTEGLINEYVNPGCAIINGVKTQVQPLEGLEHLTMDGHEYEAFNTSGGLGTLADALQGQVNELNYKTLRYPGHCEKMRFLLRDLQFNEDREGLKTVLERAIPTTKKDVVLVYVNVIGRKNHQLVEETFYKKIYPKTIEGNPWSSIQLTTASGLCAALDITTQNLKRYKGFVGSEAISLSDFLGNRFGQFYGDSFDKVSSLRTA